MELFRAMFSARSLASGLPSTQIEKRGPTRGMTQISHRLRLRGSGPGLHRAVRGLFVCKPWGTSEAGRGGEVGESVPGRLGPNSLACAISLNVQARYILPQRHFMVRIHTSAGARPSVRASILPTAALTRASATLTRTSVTTSTASRGGCTAQIGCTYGRAGCGVRASLRLCTAGTAAGKPLRALERRAPVVCLL